MSGPGDEERHARVDVGPNVGVLATDQEYQASWTSSLLMESVIEVFSHPYKNRSVQCVA